MLRLFGHLATLALLMAGAASMAGPLFDEVAVINVELAGPTGALRQDPEAREELPFTLRADGVDHQIRVRVRGKSRLRVCKFPPLRLNFKKGDTGETVFAGQDKLKLVTPCHLSERAEKDLLEEYAAYRIFNLLSDASHRVRLLRVRFSDPAAEPGGDSPQHHAFVIEPIGQLVERVQGVESDLPEIALSWLDAEQIAIVFVFQYLIGNTDWSLVRPYREQACCHNGALIETDAKTLYVPYDFDLAGLVDAPYARPDPELRISSVTQRRYRGFCMDREILRGAIATVRSREDDILAVIAGLPVLTDKDKDKRSNYLRQFFDAAQNEDKVLRQFEKRCIS